MWRVLFLIRKSVVKLYGKQNLLSYSSQKNKVYTSQKNSQENLSDIFIKNEIPAQMFPYDFS